MRFVWPIASLRMTAIYASLVTAGCELAPHGMSRTSSRRYLVRHIYTIRRYMAYADKEKEKVARARAKKRYYEAHKESERRKALERITRRRTKSYEYVDHIKSTTPCADCGETFPSVCMDFDHCKDQEKIGNVSRLVNLGKSLDIIKAEIDKCELVCACCHRIRTQSRY